MHTSNKEKQDIRWHQRFSNFRKALAKMRQAVEMIELFHYEYGTN